MRSVATTSSPIPRITERSPSRFPDGAACRAATPPPAPSPAPRRPPAPRPSLRRSGRSEEHTSELQSPCNLVCRLLLEKKKTKHAEHPISLPHGIRRVGISCPFVVRTLSWVLETLENSNHENQNAYSIVSTLFPITTH